MEEYMEKKPNREEVLKKIKEVILSTAKKHGIEVDKIILFGSRARGDYKEESDWDILIVTKEKIDWKKRKMFLSEIRRNLIAKDIIPEVLLVDKGSFEKYKNLTGFVYYWAEKEGVLIA